jgi:hypothetical protein
MVHSADMFNARFPQRFVERTVDYLHPDPGALKVGCLIKKTRVAGSRYHHFYEKIVNGSLELDTWMGAFVYPVHQQNGQVAVVLGVNFRQPIVLWNLLWSWAAVVVI